MTVDELQVLITANTNELRKEINKANKNISSLQKSATKSAGGVTSAFKKLKTGIMALGIGKVIKDSIQSGMDAIESDSLFETSLGSYADDVRAWSEEMAGALGLSDVAMRKNAGVIYNMTSSMGVAQENALKMSKGITLLSEDMASFYNLDSAEAFNKLRAGITGETEPLKALGILVDENTVKQVAYSEGIAENGAELTQQQKVLARYVAILKQTGNAQGDLARTIDSPSNQLRRLKQQVENLRIELSNFFLPIVQVALQWLSAFAKVAMNALNSLKPLANKLASFLGVSSSSASDETETISENVNGLASGYDDATKSAKKLKNSLAGFDEMNTLQDNSSDSDSTSSAGVGADIGYSLGDYDAHLDWISETTDDLVSKAEKILTFVGAIGVAFGTWKIGKTILDFFINPGNLGYFKMMGDLFKVGDSLGALTTGDKLTSLGGAISAVAGVVMLAYGAFDAWINGLDWKNLALMIGGVTVAVTGLYFAIKPFHSEIAKLVAGIGAVVGGLVLVVIGVKDFVENGPTLKNTILIIGGAIAVAVGLATAGLSVLVSAIVGAVVAIGAFVTAILLEKPAIMSVEEAQNQLTEAKNRAVEAENSYINAVDGAENALKTLEEAEKKAGVTGEELYKQVQEGTLDYADMTDAQKEVYKAYLDNEQKQKDLKEATEELNDAKKAETLASFENQLALAKESGSYDEFKKSVVDAFEKGELSADEARELMSKSMSEMSDDAQKTFMEDIPSDIKNGLDPNKYETTRKKIGDWFGSVGKFITEKLWQPIVNWWDTKVKPIFTKEYWVDKFNTIKEGAKSALNGVLSVVETAINWLIRKMNGLSWDIPDWVPLVGGKKFGFNLKEVSLPRLAQGGIVDRPTYAMIGEAGKEAVMPLERNTGWIDQLAGKIGDKIDAVGGDIHLVVKLGEDAIFDRFIEYGKDKAFETNGEVVFI